MRAAKPAALLTVAPTTGARRSPELRRGTSHRVRLAVLLRSLTHTSTFWEGGHHPHPQSPDYGDVFASLCHFHGGLRSSEHFPCPSDCAWSHRLGRNQQTCRAASGRAGHTSLLLSEAAVRSAAAGPTPRMAVRRRGVTEPAPGEGRRPHIPQTTQRHSSRPPPVPDLRAHGPAVLPNAPHVGTDQRTRPWPQTKDRAPLHPPVWFCPKPQTAAENKARRRPLGALVSF